MAPPEQHPEQDRRLTELVDKAMQELRQEFVSRLAETEGRLAREVARGAGSASIDSLHGAVSALDRGRNQTEILSALLERATHFASRAILLLTGDGKLQGWASSGFSASSEAVGSLTLSGTEDSPWARAAAGEGVVELDREACAAACRGLDGSRPAGGLLIPLVLRDRVAATLYADRLSAEDPLERSALQLLTHLTALSIETLPLRERHSTATLRMAAGAAAAPVESVAPPAEPEPAVSVEAAPEPAIEAAAPEPAVAEPAAPEPAAPEPAAPVPAAPEPAAPEPAASEPAAPEPAAPEPAVAEPAWKPAEEPDLWQPPAAEPPPVAPDLEEPAPPVVEPMQPAEAAGFAVEPAAPAAPEPAPLPEPEPQAPPAATFAPPAAEPATRTLDPGTTPIEPAAPPLAAPPELEPAAPPPAAPPELTPPAAPPAPAASGTQILPPDDLQGPGWAFTSAAGAAADGGEDSQHEEARRLARLLVTEIKLYNEEAVEEGLRKRNIYDVLRDDIDRSRQIFEERISEEVRAENDYFQSELVRILAGGDANVLGT